MIRWIKGDFRNVRAALEQLVGRKVPFGACLVYYVIVALLVLPFAPILWLIYQIKLKRLMKELKGYSNM